MSWFTPLHKYGSPKFFYDLSGRLIPWLAMATAVCFIAGLYYGLYASPPDYQQGESVRIMYIHVPSAWMSMFVYSLMAFAGAATLVWHAKITEVLASAAAPLGASFTALALVTGSIWGKPMWGTWWEWDARLTGELILFFLYIGYMSLEAAIDDPRRAARATAVLALVSVAIIPIIHFSVEWWNTLHQPASVTRAAKPAIHPDILKPLLLMFLAFNLYFFTLLLVRMRSILVERERNTSWVASLFGGKS
ncbi:MAG: heme ABC transporter permease [Pseudomonadota bacterium]